MNKALEHCKIRATTPARSRLKQLTWIALPLLFAGLAAAEDHPAPAGSETTEIRVHYERKDLTSAAGARRLLARIDSAALESCGASSFSLPELKNAVLASQCYRDAVEKAVHRIDSPLLSAAASEDQRLALN